MSNSLHDQLFKAGLVDDKQAKKAQKDMRKRVKQQRKSKAVDPGRQEAQQALAQSAGRDRALNRQRNAEVERKAIMAQIRQLIETNRQSREDAEVAYQFADNGKIKRIFVTAPQLKQISQGRLAIVWLGERYELVPAPVAEKIRTRDEGSVILCNEAQEPKEGDVDDPYADYQIPDDLMW